ncbi:MAG: tetratricopeptide repeat protein, partial [Burkholderiaceae bacterium]|nr:tetratricopeptide repeat protein [Burkholderiaceae bacterium]
MLRPAGRWLRRGVLMVALAGTASVALAQSAGAEPVPAPAPAASSWTDWSTWSGLWSWRSDGKPPPPTGVQSPHYGDSLFYFYQGRYFTSVTQLMVSQHFARLSPHDDEAEVLRGGLFLSYGLHREAGEVFARLIERGAAPTVRNRAWYYLAKIRFQRNRLSEAEDALARIEPPLPGDLEEDR